MTLKEKIDQEIKTAVLTKDVVKKEILKFIKSEVQRIEGGLRVLDDADIEKLMRTQIENLKLTPSSTSNQEIAILQQYLPQFLSDDEIKQLVDECVKTKTSIGEVMKFFATHYKGKVDNKKVSEFAKAALKI